MDEPMGCHDDFEHAVAFVLRAPNMAEMHPILWTRIADRRRGNDHVREPGNSPFPLAGQPSACGTAREVGTFAHRPPADMTVRPFRN